MAKISTHDFISVFQFNDDMGSFIWVVTAFVLRLEEAKLTNLLLLTVELEFL